MQAYSIAVGGMQSAVQRFDVSASNIANSPATGSDITKDIVNQSLNSAAFTANLAVAKSADQMTKQLLDIKV